MAIEKQLTTHNSTLKTHTLWNALYVKSRHEKKVAAYMEKYDIPCYLPLTKGLKIWSDRKKWVEEPLFRGYIFVPHNHTIADTILQIPGVVNYVRYNGDKAIIKAEELKVIQHFIEEGYHIDNIDPESINPGDFVEIQAGPFKGMKGEIAYKANKQEFTLLLETIGQTIKINLPGEVLKRER